MRSQHKKLLIVNISLVGIIIILNFGLKYRINSQKAFNSARTVFFSTQRILNKNTRKYNVGTTIVLNSANSVNALVDSPLEAKELVDAVETGWEITIRFLAHDKYEIKVNKASDSLCMDESLNPCRSL